MATGTPETRDSYYMLLASAVRERSKCAKRRVGSIIVRENRVLSTGYNGTPQGVDDCIDGGCGRCGDPNVQPGELYDLCLCVHAEENALITGTRFGTSLADGDLYTTLEPCFICLRELLQAQIRNVYFLDPWKPGAEIEKYPWILPMKESLKKRFASYSSIAPMYPKLMMAEQPWEREEGASD